MPLWFSFLFGKTIGLAIYANPRKRTIAFRNIKSSFPDKTNKEIKRIARKSFSNLGLIIVENLIAPKLLKYTHVQGLDKLGKEGGVIVGIHTGNWEFFNFALAQKIPYAILVKKQKNEKLDKFLNELRQQNKLQVCFSLKDIIKFLHQGWLVGLMADHGAEDNAPPVDFFGHSVPMPTGAIHIARKFNKNIFVGFTRRTKFFNHVSELKGPLDVTNKNDNELLREINKMYEDHLTQYPANYLWQHKRFKYKNDRDILILSDGKLGHLKQSQALLSFLKEEGLAMRSKIIEVKYKNKLTRNLCEICALLSSRGCLGCGRCLKYLLTQNTFEQLERTYADVVISTGSFVSPVNRIIASSLGAKAITILRSNIPLRRFDLCLIPEHDRTWSDNEVKVRGALSYPANFSEKILECKKQFNIADGKKISLFLGGPRSDRKEFVDNLGIFLGQLKKFAELNNYKILASTSRRTPEAAEAIINKELAASGVVEKIVYANRENYDFVFEGFVGMSDAVFVTSESISMISETLSLKKPCVCVLLEKHVDKHKVFLQSIEKDVDFLYHPYSIRGIKLKTSTIFEDNREAVKAAIKKIL